MKADGLAIFFTRPVYSLTTRATLMAMAVTVARPNRLLKPDEPGLRIPSYRTAVSTVDDGRG